MKVKISRSEIDTLLQRLDAQATQLAAQGREMERLRTLVEEAEDSNREAPVRSVRSRRDLLKLAGAAVVGAAGAAALRVVPAAAANGGALRIGLNNAGTATTFLTTTGQDSFSSTSSTGFGLIGVGVAGIRAVGPSATDLGGLFTGGRAPLQLFPAAVAGPPSSNAHSIGDLWMDANGIVWACITAGTPGVFAPLQTGGANISHFVKVSNQQYSLAGNDGKTWVDMDAVKLSQTITPAFNAQAVISVSTDLWTANSGFNQDIGIFISGGAYGAGKIVAWKESGGSAGTFSPNAAFVETTQPMVAGTAYTIKVRWKTNLPAGGATIFAGAGPLPPGSAGGGVAGQVSPTRLATHLVVDVPSPSVLSIPANDPSATPPPPPPLPMKN